jgi:HK97 family phage major capsid protein/HK97 family phage prohead protease
MSLNRAYSLLQIKAVDDDRRVITGIATTPEPDRMGDVVEPLGAQFKNPLPLLWQHQHDKPVGTVKFDKPTKDGIAFTAELPKLAEDGPLKQLVDMAWQSVKAQLVRGVSIGFRALEYSFMDSGGIRFAASEIIELSLVTIPANASATIQTIKSIDTTLRAASGIQDGGVARPGVSGVKASVVKTVSLNSQKGKEMNIQEQIQKFQALRQNKVKAMEAIMAKSAESGETLNAEQSDEYDGLQAEIESIDKHLDRLRAHEKALAASATAVAGTSAQEGTTTRGALATGAPSIVIRKDSDEKFKGQNYTRMVIAKALARMGDNEMPAWAIAEKRWGRSNPTLVQIMKAGVAGGGSGSGEWGAELVQADGRYTGDFIEYLYSKTVFDQLPLRQVPANVTIKGQDGAATGYWVGQSKAIPASTADFSAVSLTPLKVAALAVVSNELLRDSSPAAEQLVRDALVEASAQRVDTTFLSTTAASAGVSPAGLLNGLSAGTSAGTDGDGLRADVKALYSGFITAKNASGLMFIMNPSLAKSIQLMTNALGQTEFPGIGTGGGTLLGDNVVTGDNVNASHLILLKPSDIWRIGDMGVEVSISREAMIEQDTAPTGETDTPAAASANMTSMFQSESTAIKVVRPINFAKRRSSAVAYISDADYGAATSA